MAKLSDYWTVVVAVAGDHVVGVPLKFLPDDDRVAPWTSALWVWDSKHAATNL